jgi:predicted dehydrogenase
MRVAIVGCGGIAHTHAASCVAMPGVDLVALADIRPEALAEFGKAFRVPTENHFDDYRAMYESVKPDIVAVCTRPAQHHAPTVAALQRGIHVLCEKPVALDLVEADEMIIVSERTGAKLAINTQRHTDPVYRRAANLVRDGIIGELRTVRSECKTYRAGYGMMNIGSHYLDAMSLFAGEAAWVFAHITNAKGHEISPRDVDQGDRDTGPVAGEHCTIQIGYRSGVTGISEYWVGTTTFGFEVVGTKGALTIRGDANVMVTRGGGGKARDAIVWEPVEIALTDEERKSFEPAGRWSTVNMMAALITAIEQDAPPACSGHDGRAALEIIMAAYRSQRSGARVKLPLADRKHPLRDWT